MSVRTAIDIGGAVKGVIPFGRSVEIKMQIDQITAAEVPVYTAFDLDLSSYSAGQTALCDGGGAEVGSITMESGTLEESVYTTENGLHITSRTQCIFPVKLGDKFTIALTVCDFATSVSSTTYGLFPLMVGLPAGQFETVIHAHKAVSNTKYLWSYINRAGSANINRASWVKSIEIATDTHWIYNEAITMDWLQKAKELSIRYVADGSTVKMFVNGLLTAWQPQSEFTNDLTEIYVGSWGNSIGLEGEYTIKEFKILDYAEAPTEYTNYRMRITGVKGSTSTYMQLSELSFYTDIGVKISATNALPFALYNGYASNVSYPAASDDVFDLFDDDNTNKMCVRYADGNAFDIYFAISSYVAKSHGQYCYITGNDYPERDPVTWTLERCTDGETWETISTVTNAEITDERNAQTDMFKFA